VAVFPLTVLLSPIATEKSLLATLKLPTVTENKPLAVLLSPIAIAFPQLATCVFAVLPFCKSTAEAPLLLPPEERLLGTCASSAQVPFAANTTSTSVAALVAVKDTTGTVTFGAEVFIASVKFVRLDGL